MKWFVSAALTLALVCQASAAEAHAQLQFTNPKVSSTLYVLPATISLTFDDDLIEFAGSNQIVVTDPKNKPLHLGNTSVSGSKLNVKLSKSTALGRYKVTWRALSADGHPVSGYYYFYLARKK